MLLTGWSRLDWIRFLPPIMGAAKLVSRVFWFFLGRLSQKDPPPAQGMESVGCFSTQKRLSPKAHFQKKGRMKAAILTSYFPSGFTPDCFITTYRSQVSQA